MTQTQDITTPDLLPCPFCGAAPKVECSVFKGRNVMSVWCDVPACGFAETYASDPEAVAKRWNARIAPIPPPNVAQAARVLLDNLPGEHKAWESLQNTVDDGCDVGDCMKAFHRAHIGELK